MDHHRDREDLRRLLPADDVSIQIATGGGVEDVGRESSGGRLFSDEEERYGTFSSSPQQHSPSSVVHRLPDKVSRWRQTASATGFCLGALAMGNALGWSSTAVPDLESPTSSLHIDKDEAAWVSSLLCLGAMLQGPATGYLMQKFGRRGSVILMCLPLLAGWMFIVFATDVSMLYAGRLLTGAAIGSFSVVAPIYIAEIASPSLRGTLGTLFQTFVVLGIFSMYLIGKYVRWKTLAILCSAVPFAIVVVLFFLRDSPTSYLMRGRPELARKAMVWLRPDVRV